MKWAERPDLIIAIAAFVLSLLILAIAGYFGWDHWSATP